jgi:hypothetical protein
MIRRIPKSHAYPAESLRYTTILDGGCKGLPRQERSLCTIPPQAGKSTAAASTSCLSGNRGNAASVGNGFIGEMRPLHISEEGDLPPLFGWTRFLTVKAAK